jgi:hypothetical protein
MLRLHVLRAVLGANVLLLFLPPVLPADRHGEPLPAAVVRLGSSRFRHPDTVHFVAFSPDGKLLLSSMDNGIYYVWGRETGRLLHRFTNEKVSTTPSDEGPPPLANGPASFCADSKTLAIVSDDRCIHVWDVASGKKVRVLHGPKDVLAVAFSPDGKLLALGGDGLFCLRNTATGKDLARVGHQLGPVTALTFSPDGKHLVSGAADTTAIVWDVAALIRKSQQRRAEPTRKQLEDWWTDLASADAERAYSALWALADARQRAVPFLAEQLRPAPAVDGKHIAQLIAELDSNRFAVRQQAAKKLEQLGDIAAPALKKVLENAPSLELQRRIERLLPKVSGLNSEVLRGIRAVEALERIGTPEARKVLAALTSGAPEARLTREARAALQRLGSTKR